jgi:hypothetical protein
MSLVCGGRVGPDWVEARFFGGFQRETLNQFDPKTAGEWQAKLQL